MLFIFLGNGVFSILLFSHQISICSCHLYIIFYFHFFSVQSVPRNTSSAITTQTVNGENRFNIYYPPTTGNYSSYYIQKPQRMINLLIPEKDMNRQLYNQDIAFKAEIEKDVQEKESKQRERIQMLHEKRGHEVSFGIIGKN